MRRVQLEVGGRSFETDVDDAVHLSIPLDFDGDQARAFGLSPASSEPVPFEEAVCDTEQGGAFNADILELIPHGNGTHTETVGHLVDQDVPVGEQLVESLIPCTVLSVEPRLLGETGETYPNRSEPSDEVLTRRRIQRRASALQLPAGFFDAVVLHTRSAADAEPFRDYSGTNPPYPTTEALDWLVEREVEHLLVDLPSIDRESEGGRLANHRRFWELGPDERRQDPPSPKTVTELVHVPESLPDGIYFLDIDVPNFSVDAAPSRPLVYEAVAAG